MARCTGNFSESRKDQSYREDIIGVEWANQILYETVVEGIFVDAKGRVFRRQLDVEFHEVATRIGSHGYPTVFLKELGKQILLHRLVAQTLLAPPMNPDAVLVLHFDDNRLNPCIENLYWGSPSDNVLDCIRNNEGRHPLALLDDSAVREIRKNKDKTLTELAAGFAVSISTVWKCKQGLTYKRLLGGSDAC